MTSDSRTKQQHQNNNNSNNVSPLASYGAIANRWRAPNAANTALTDADAPANSVFMVSGQQLAPLCHSRMQRAVLALPGRDVLFVRGGITPQQLDTQRLSYVNAILIQRAGILIPAGCNECRRRGFTPFPECRRVVGQFGGACGNCKWRDHAARCRTIEPDKGDSDSGDESGSEDDAPRRPDPPPRIADNRRRQRPLGGGSAVNPVVL
jgi:Protein of unknown function (DUF3716)